jgi:hypothetical protein
LIGRTVAATSGPVAVGAKLAVEAAGTVSSGLAVGLEGLQALTTNNKQAIHVKRFIISSSSCYLNCKKHLSELLPGDCWLPGHFLTLSGELIHKQYSHFKRNGQQYKTE